MHNCAGFCATYAHRQTIMKKCIYVVDDQVPVMETAVLIMRSIDPQWEVSGFKDPLQALAAVQAKAPDLILTDQVMPEMLGGQLLEQVRTISPTTIRIIMSGYVALNKRALPTSAHQYIAKPFDTIKLREMVRRSFAAQERMADKGLQTLVTSLRSIPSLPQAHHALLRELEDNRNATANIARLVGEDAGLSLKVLQLANSPLFGQDYLIDSPFDAVMCLGTDMITAVVLSQSLFQHYESQGMGEINPRQVWSHCWQTAYLAQHICREMRLSRISGEEAFLAGLMHETGRFILADNFPDQFQAACHKARQMKSPLVPRLREAFQASPAQISAYVLELWGMPAGIIAAISQMDSPVRGQFNGFSLAAALYIGDSIASRQMPPDALAAEEWDEAYLKAVGCLESIPVWEKLLLGQKPGVSQ
jgi:HD-like signal output (HDOD) protein